MRRSATQRNVAYRRLQTNQIRFLTILDTLHYNIIAGGGAIENKAGT